jgi:hypothetical protein
MKPKQLSYFFGSLLRDKETIVDYNGSIDLPQKGDVVEKKGRKWTVEVVMASPNTEGRLPRYDIYMLPLS